MCMTDPIADMLTRIRNGLLAKHDYVYIPFSKNKKRIAQILKEEGYINNYKVTRLGTFYNIKVYLKYVEGDRAAIYGIKRVSKPGCRVYVSKKDIPVVLNGLGESIVSTNQGLHTGRECKKKGIGGEVICEVW